MFEVFDQDTAVGGYEPLRSGPVVQVDQRGLLLFNYLAWELLEPFAPERSGLVKVLFDRDARVAAVQPTTFRDVPRGARHDLVSMRSDYWVRGVWATTFVGHYGVQVGDYPARFDAGLQAVTFEVGAAARQSLGVVEENVGLVSTFPRAVA